MITIGLPNLQLAVDVKAAMADNPTNQGVFQDVRIVNELGLHARSAAKIAQLARQASGSVWLEKNQGRADAKQVIDLLMLAAARGDWVRISIDQTGDRDTLNQIVRLVEDGFGE